MDLHERRVMFATPGKDADTVKAFAADLGVHGGRPQTQVQRVCCDMSPAFIKGINQYLSEQSKTEEQKPLEEEEAGAGTAVEVVEPAAAMVATGELHRPQIVFDRFHVVAKANEAVDEVRRAEVKTRPELKRSRYTWLKNESHLTAKQAERLTWLTRPSMRLKTTRAARWRDDFNGFYEQSTREQAHAYLKRWCYGAKRCRLEPIKEFVAMVEAHWAGIIAWQDGQLSNGLLEGTNSLVQAAKRRGSRLPIQGQDDHHHLPHRRQAPITRNPHDLARSPGTSPGHRNGRSEPRLVSGPAPRRSEPAESPTGPAAPCSGDPAG